MIIISILSSITGVPNEILLLWIIIKGVIDAIEAILTVITLAFLTMQVSLSIRFDNVATFLASDLSILLILTFIDQLHLFVKKFIFIIYFFALVFIQVNF